MHPPQTLTDFLRAHSVDDAPLHGVHAHGPDLALSFTLPEGAATLTLRGAQGSPAVGVCACETVRLTSELSEDGQVNVRLVVLNDDTGAIQAFGWRCEATVVTVYEPPARVPELASARAQVGHLLISPPPRPEASTIVRWRRADASRWDPRLLWFERMGQRPGRWLPEGPLQGGDVLCGFDADNRLRVQKEQTSVGIERTDYGRLPDGRVAVHRSPEGSPRWALRLWTDARGRPAVCAWQGSRGTMVERYHYEDRPGETGRLTRIEIIQGNAEPRWVEVEHDDVGRVMRLRQGARVIFRRPEGTPEAALAGWVEALVRVVRPLVAGLAQRPWAVGLIGSPASSPWLPPLLGACSLDERVDPEVRYAPSEWALFDDYRLALPEKGLLARAGANLEAHARAGDGWTMVRDALRAAARQLNGGPVLYFATDYEAATLAADLTASLPAEACATLRAEGWWPAEDAC
jgi:hypothetical protein